MICKRETDSAIFFPYPVDTEHISSNSLQGDHYRLQNQSIKYHYIYLYISLRPPLMSLYPLLSPLYPISWLVESHKHPINLPLRHDIYIFIYLSVRITLYIQTIVHVNICVHHISYINNILKCYVNKWGDVFVKWGIPKSPKVYEVMATPWMIEGTPMT